MKKLLLCFIALTIQTKAAPELKFMGDESEQIYNTIKGNTGLTTEIKETILTANFWHPLKGGNGSYSFSDLANVLRSAHLYLSLDIPLTLKIPKVTKDTRGATQQVKIKEIIVGLHQSEDGKMTPNRFFAVTDSGAVIVLQLISGHKIVTELEPQITKMQNKAQQSDR